MTTATENLELNVMSSELSANGTSNGAGMIIIQSTMVPVKSRHAIDDVSITERPDIMSTESPLPSSVQNTNKGTIEIVLLIKHLIKLC